MIPGSRKAPDAGTGPDIDVYSPDRSVRIAATSRGDIAVEVDGLHRHTEDSLARQVRAAARVALASLQPPVRDVDPSVNEQRSGW
ncbi:hypothetical protein KBX26_02805 [Micromonospora sp. C97]|uniref:hypothetical protein n=1 Tax=Micromonospora sp. C97 TaxID=2824883 RepID=UPI001B37B207|nr:hypothetical protein [Micromonospora sp. C97]MBQ1028937.1 hypothetical protein [Micromonospora sp. C97]